MAAKPRHLIVGIDFGSTYSGMCYAELDHALSAASLDTIRISNLLLQRPFQNMAGHRGNYQDYHIGSESNHQKVPTWLCYAKAGKCACNVISEPITTPVSVDTKTLPGDERLPYRWGYEVNSRCRSRVDFFKLWIDADTKQRSTSSVNPTHRGRSARNRSSYELIRDYLKGMRLACMRKLRHFYPDEALEDFRFDWVFTYPTFYGPDLVAEFHRIVIDAGFPETTPGCIRFLQEPTAALFEALQIYSMDTGNKTPWEKSNVGVTTHVDGSTQTEGDVSEDDHILKVGDGVIICDAGGGTTDFQAFKITKLYDNEDRHLNLELEHLSTHRGARLGAIDINNRFDANLRNLCNLLAPAMTVMEEEQAGMFKKEIEGVNAEFERAKILFSKEKYEVKTDFIVDKAPFGDARDHDKSQQYVMIYRLQSLKHISFPEAGLIEGELTMTRDDMKELFAPTMRGLMSHLASFLEHVRKSIRGGNIRASSLGVKAFVFVGGLSASSYVEKVVETWVENQTGMFFITPANQNERLSAVMLGAIKYRLQEIRDRKTPIKDLLVHSHMGFVVNVDYDPSHGEDPGLGVPNMIFETDEFTGRRITRGWLRWAVITGETYPVNKIGEGRFGYTASIRTTIRFSKRSQTSSWVFPVIRSNGEELPPIAMWHLGGADVVEMCTITVHPQMINKSRCASFQCLDRDRTKPWKKASKWYEIDLQLELSMSTEGVLDTACYEVARTGKDLGKSFKLPTGPDWNPGKVMDFGPRWIAPWRRPT